MGDVVFEKPHRRSQIWVEGSYSGMILRGKDLKRLQVFVPP